MHSWHNMLFILCGVDRHIKRPRLFHWQLLSLPAHATTQTHTFINPAISCLKKLHKTTTPTPHRKPQHHPRQLAHPGLIYIPLAPTVHLPLLLFVRPESSWGVYPKGGGLLKNGQVRPLNSGHSE